MKWRNSKERELLSSGASRDVTLPGKDNPHPDLTDALRHHDMTSCAEGFPSAGAGGFPVVSATDLRMRNVDYGGRREDMMVYDVIGATADKHHGAKTAGRLSEESSDRDDTIHVI